jgi:hypothetical protein
LSLYGWTYEAIGRLTLPQAANALNEGKESTSASVAETRRWIRSMRGT